MHALVKPFLKKLQLNSSLSSIRLVSNLFDISEVTKKAVLDQLYFLILYLIFCACDQCSWQILFLIKDKILIAWHLLKSKEGEVVQAVTDAIDIGYRHIDTAFAYGNENEIGAAIKAKLEDGTVKREELYITTKVHMCKIVHIFACNAVKFIQKI